MFPVEYPEDQGGYVAPENYSVWENVAFAQRAGMEGDGYLWFYKQVKPGGPWDYKRTKDDSGNGYEGLGNWNYGAVGYAMGIPEWMLLRLPGFWQEVSKPEWNHPLADPPYGDDPLDQEQIRRGIEWAKNNTLPLPERLPDLSTLLDYLFGEWLEKRLLHTTLEISGYLNERYQSAIAWVQRRDPLTLDLDGDGLETVGIDTANPILFDHDGDGVKNATGWVKPDDGFLVLDRNGDGVINNGTELFGDSTPVLDAQGNFVRKAADGFDALAQQDSNGDGLVNHQDANWASLRVWQDANGDGISQSSELKTLEQLGIAALRVAKTENNSAIGNGNVLADLGGYIRQDGSEGTLGEVSGTMADIDLADNPFYREFTDSVDTSAVAQLPDMQGSGAVRDLREAAALSPGLASVLQSYASATTKAEQTALLGELLNQWGATGNFNTSVERAQEQGFSLRYFNSQGQDVTAWVELLETFNGATFVQVGEVGRYRAGYAGCA